MNLSFMGFELDLGEMSCGFLKGKETKTCKRFWKNQKLHAYDNDYISNESWNIRGMLRLIGHEALLSTAMIGVLSSVCELGSEPRQERC